MCTHIHPPNLTQTYLQIAIIPAINTFIDTTLANDNAKFSVLRCVGINRSVSAICAYLCHKNGWTATEARKFLKGKKANVDPYVICLGQIDGFYG